jgi:hypothetical protein
MAAEINFEQVIAALPQLDAGELANMINRASSLLLNKEIGDVAIGDVAIGSVAKKKVAAIPSQLERNHEWTKFVLADATMNGWESFVMRTSKLNKETQEKEVTEVELRESVETEKGHVFADTGKSMSQGQAMCYGKLLRDREDVVWKDFDSQYAQVAPKASAKVVKKSSQQVEEEKKKKAAEKEAEKERKAAEKAAEKAKKEEEKRKKEEEKAAKKPVSKTIVPRPRPRSPAPAAAAAVVVEEVEEMPELEALPAPVVVAPVVVAPKGIVMKKKVVKEVRPAVDPFKLPEDCTHNVWLWKETQYLRDADNYLWLFDATTQEQGDFKGRYNYAKDEIEECEEPQFVEDEEELDA